MLCVCMCVYTLLLSFLPLPDPTRCIPPFLSWYLQYMGRLAAVLKTRLLKLTDKSASTLNRMAVLDGIYLLLINLHAIHTIVLNLLLVFLCFM